MYKILTKSFYGLDHDQIFDEYDGAEFIGEFQIKDLEDNWTPLPVSCYFIDDQEKFLFFYMNGKDLLVGEKTKDEMEENASQEGIHCKKCDYVIYSKFRHDVVECYCGNVKVEGGKDFLKYTANSMESIAAVNINFITGEINPLRRTIQ